MTARALASGARAYGRYDLIAIGSGPAGQGAALQAAKLGKRAAVVERDALGGASVNTGTIPSKTLRAAVVDHMRFARGANRRTRRVNRELAITDLLWRTQPAIELEQEAVQDELRRNRIDLLRGTASFLGPHTLRVESQEGCRVVVADRFVIAVGTKPSHPAGVAFDHRTVLDSDGILHLSSVPRTLTVVGATVFGLELASMAAALGTQVTVVDRRAQMLEFVDHELVEALRYHLAGIGVAFRLGEHVESVERTNDRVYTKLAGGNQIESELVFYAAGRHGATSSLNLAAVGLEPTDLQRVVAGTGFRTAQRHIFAAGDVIGLPSSAAMSREQGRFAALAAFGQPPSELEVGPFGVYTIPEISFVGSREEELVESEVPYVRGVARYRELTRGEIAGDRSGLLKLTRAREDGPPPGRPRFRDRGSGADPPRPGGDGRGLDSGVPRESRVQRSHICRGVQGRCSRRGQSHSRERSFA